MKKSKTEPTSRVEPFLDGKKIVWRASGPKDPRDDNLDTMILASLFVGIFAGVFGLMLVGGYAASQVCGASKDCLAHIHQDSPEVVGFLRMFFARFNEISGFALTLLWLVSSATRRRCIRPGGERWFYAARVARTLFTSLLTAFIGIEGALLFQTGSLLFYSGIVWAAVGIVFLTVLLGL